MITHWTKEQTQFLVDQLKEGTPVLRIAKALGKTPAACYHRKFNLGLSDGRRPHPVYSNTAKIDEVLRLFNEGYAVKAIGPMTELTYDLVRQILRRTGVRARKKYTLKGARTYAPEQVEAVRRMIMDEKKTQRATALCLGVRYTVVRDICLSRGFKSSRKWSPQQIDDMEAMLRAGDTIEAIATKIGKLPHTVYRRASSLARFRDYAQIKAYNETHTPKEVTVRKLLRVRLKAAQHSRRSRGIECSIDLAYLEWLICQQEGRCFYTGVALSTVEGDPCCVSLDRYDSSRGYVEGNVVLCSWTVNKMKQDIPFDDFIRLCGVLAHRWVGLKAAVPRRLAPERQPLSAAA